MKKNRPWESYLLISIMLLFFYIPIIMTVIFSFNSSRSLTSWSGFSWQWYEKLWNSREMMQAVKNSLIIASISTVISTIVGTITAIGLSNQKKILRSSISFINNIPVMNPEIVTAIGFMLLYASIPGLEKGFITLLIAHITFSIPYVILTVMPKLRSLDPSLADAAMDLGASPAQALWKVIIPQITPAIISGALIAFTMSFDDFVISYFSTGKGVSNISIIVYTMSKRINPTINALSTIIIVVISLILIGMNLIPLIKKKERKGYV